MLLRRFLVTGGSRLCFVNQAGHVSKYHFQDLHGNIGTVMHHSSDMEGRQGKDFLLKPQGFNSLGKKKWKQKMNKRNPTKAIKQKQQQNKETKKQIKTTKKPTRRKEFSQWHCEQTSQTDKEKSLDSIQMMHKGENFESSSTNFYPQL